MAPIDLAAVLVVVLMISILWTNLVGAPWTPTTTGKVHKMLSMADVGPDDVVYDLGCGDGRTLVIAARRYGARAVGIEIDPLRYLWCQLLITVLGLRRRVKIRYGDFFSQDLGEADVVTCYLLPRTNEELEAKFKQELNPNARIISNSFIFPGLKLQGQDDEANIYFYCPTPDVS